VPKLRNDQTVQKELAVCGTVILSTWSLQYESQLDRNRQELLARFLPIPQPVQQRVSVGIAKSLRPCNLFGYAPPAQVGLSTGVMPELFLVDLQRQFQHTRFDGVS